MYWVKIQIILNILAFSVNVANTEECVSSTQCSDWEICRNEVCEDAVKCGGDSDPCASIPELVCVSDYCQPDPCTSTGQCVNGHVCEHDTPSSCVYPIVYDIEEISEFTLQFQEPASPGSYEELYWYKGGRSSLDRLAIFHPVITDNKPQYYGDFCSGNSPCRESDRAHLNTDTGELTIHSVELSDQDFYYYNFYADDVIPDTGNKYEYKLNVYVVYCGGNNNRCASISGMYCVSDYCQTDPCKSTGQCVHGHVCEQGRSTDNNCVYPVVYTIAEGSEFTLAFQEPGTSGTYEEIEWYKGSKSSLGRAAIIDPVITENKPQYYNDFCSGNSPCRTSDRALLNTHTGELTIHSVKLSDEGFYYYTFYAGHGILDTGIKYEYKLNVYVTPHLKIEGISDYVEVGTNLTLTCIADRIRPEPIDMYWEIKGTNVNGNITARDDDGDGVFTYRSYFVYTVAKEDANKPITCVVVPVYGDAVTMETIINPGYAPNGKPVIRILKLGQFNGETVLLICENPTVAGSPPCYAYDWIKQEGNSTNLPTTQVYTFIMDELNAGNYSCQCSNEFGESEVSDQVEIVYLEERPKDDTTTGTVDVGLIAGCAVGGLSLVTLVIVAVIICRKYKVNFNINVDLNFKSRKDGEKNTCAVNTVDSNGYENPVASQSRARSTVNEYAEINEGAMVRTRQEGYVNVTMTTYEDLL